jgi:hypothetical protein
MIYWSAFAARLSGGLEIKAALKSRVRRISVAGSPMSPQAYTIFRDGAGAPKHLHAIVCGNLLGACDRRRSGGAAVQFTFGRTADELHWPGGNVASGNIDQVETNRLDDGNRAAGRAELPHCLLDVEVDGIVADIQDHPDIPG